MYKSIENQKLTDTAKLGQDGDEVSQERRKAVAKLAYASPVIAGLLFSRRAAAQFNGSPPPTPG